MIKKVLSIIISFMLFSITVSASPVLAQMSAEGISEFHTDLTINRDSTLSIREKIQYFTPIEKHGIFRYIPYRYQWHGLTYTARISDVKVTDEDLQPIPIAEQKYDNGNFFLKIGDKDKTFIGLQTYIITYTVHDALRTENGQAQLNWDITGEGWQIPIERSTATLNSPTSIHQSECLSGTFGGNDNLCKVKEINDHQVQFTYPHLITYGQNMTIDVQLDANGITFPTPLQRLITMFSLNALLLLLMIPLFVVSFVWFKNGRDWLYVTQNVFDHGDRPTQQKSWFSFVHVPFVYEPLELTPGQAGTLMDEKFDTQDLVAEIVDLAHRKFIKIEEVQKKTLFKAADYRFTLLKATNDTLPAHQRYLLESLFAGSSKTVKLSELKGTFYTHVEKLKNEVFASLVSAKLFTNHPETIRNIAAGLIIGASIVELTFIAPFLSMQIFFGSPVPFLLTVAQGAIAFFISRHLPQKTAKGHNHMLQAKGLQQTIQRGAWREKIKEKRLFIEEILPFAISLGVIDQLSRDMQELNLKPPQYVSGTYVHSGSFSSFSHSFSSEVGSGLSYNPSSSSSSGGGSGGGGGGGGGGSW